MDRAPAPRHRSMAGFLARVSKRVRETVDQPQVSPRAAAVYLGILFEGGARRGWSLNFPDFPKNVAKS